MIVRHDITFRRISPFSASLYEATCTCGWTMRGPKDECELRSAVHDLIDDERKTEHATCD